MFILLFEQMLYMSDTEGYIVAAKNLFGVDNEPDRLFRLTKPAALILPGFFGLAGWQVTSGFLIQNILALFGSAYLAYRIGWLLYGDKHAGVVSMILLLACSPMIIYGLAFVTDITGWFFALLIVERVLSNKNIWLTGLFAGIGMLFKESVLAGVVFGMVYWFLSDKRLGMTNALKLIGGAVLPLLIGYGLVYMRFGYTPIDWLVDAHSEGYMTSWLGVLQQLERTFDVYWLLVPLGFWTIYRDPKIDRKPIIAASSIWVLFLFWPYAQDRIFFMAVPFLLVAGTAGARFVGRLAIPIVLLGALINLDLSFMIYRVGMEGLVPISLAVYAVILGLVAYAEKQRY
jgi:hypothetical protein